jgi:toxin ParE1/3/4
MATEGRQLRLTPLAEADLEEIWRYTFSHWSVEQAERYHRDLVATMEALASGQKTGLVCTVRDGYFKYAVGSHMVFYRLTERSLDVLRILHQRMDVGRQL